jgi:hypothetical protein
VSGLTIDGAEMREAARHFAESVATAVQRHPTADPWRPGAAVADVNEPLERALAAVGWDDLAADPALLPVIAPGAVALGRGLAPLSALDRLLGGALVVDRQARYATEEVRLVMPDRGRLFHAVALELRPVGYLDAVGVSEVAEMTDVTALEPEESEQRMSAWIAASAGYLAGLADAALEAALEHARSREAFGRPLAALDAVQQHLATAATMRDGVALLTSERVSPSGLAHAADAACRVTAICHQVCGAVGFTLEFQLHRTFRRARAMQVWADSALAAWSEPA